MDKLFKTNVLQIILIFTFIGSILFSCNKLVNKKEAEKLDILKTKQIEFEKKFENEPKLFLSFWDGMSEEEYKKVVNILIKENILKGEYPLEMLNINNCPYLTISANFENDSLREIKIPLTNCLYSIYNEKYNLPNLVKRTYPDLSGSEIKWVQEEVLKETPIVIDKGKNLLFLDYQLHMDFRTDNPKQESLPSFGNSYGEMVVYYKSKKTYDKQQKIKQEKIKNHKKEINLKNKREKQLIDEL